MKRNAIGRIIVYAVLALVLTGILVSGIQDGKANSITLEGDAKVDVKGIKNLQINWAAGSVEVRPGEGDYITISETGPATKHRASYSIDDGTLSITYGRAHSMIGNALEKHLVITVPKDWHCEELDLNCAALDIQLVNLDVSELQLNGAGCELRFLGSVEDVSINGASTTVDLESYDRVSSIDINGADCKLDLTLPSGCGFQVEMNGLGGNFHSTLPGISQNDSYAYGDQFCKIEINGVGCDIHIEQGFFVADEV